MSNFTFKLETVLRVRTVHEDEAKQAYLMKVAERVGVENELDAISKKKIESLVATESDLQSRLTSAAYVELLDEQAHQLQTIISVLQNEESKAMNTWLTAKVDRQAMEKLREQKREEWQLEENRAEQRALDEWATMRRPA